jgi:hypothetical protein
MGTIPKDQAVLRRNLAQQCGATSIAPSDRDSLPTDSPAVHYGEYFHLRLEPYHRGFRLPGTSTLNSPYPLISSDMERNSPWAIRQSGLWRGALLSEDGAALPAPQASRIRLAGLGLTQIRR